MNISTLSTEAPLPLPRIQTRDPQQGFLQPVAVINYPNDYAFTRVTEFKHLTGQEHAKTSIVYEFSQAEAILIIPFPCGKCRTLQAVSALAEAADGVHFVGRLATYRYYNMDQVAAQALTVFAQMAGLSRAEAIELEYEPKLTAVTFP